MGDLYYMFLKGLCKSPVLGPFLSGSHGESLLQVFKGLCKKIPTWEPDRKGPKRGDLQRPLRNLPVWSPVLKGHIFLALL
jgi:hypothetical protein